MKKLFRNNHGDMNMILAAIVMAITLAIGIIIIYNVAAVLDTSTLDNTLASNLGHASTGANEFNDSTNATVDLLSNIATFFTIAPIALIVVAAVGILGYVLLLRRRG